MEKSKRIKVLLVDDSRLALAMLERIFRLAPDVEVVGKAGGGEEALALVHRLKPDVICTDLHMPRMGGLEMTRRVMAEVPTPILVISLSVNPDEDGENIFALLEAGAVDVFPKFRGTAGEEFNRFSDDMLRKVRTVAGVFVFRRHHRHRTVEARMPAPPPGVGAHGREIKLLAIGASTGGPVALDFLFRSLPGDFPVPILCVQHISAGFLDGLVRWLASNARLRVKSAEQGEIPRPGTVYFPREAFHLECDGRGRLHLSPEGARSEYCPSVDVLFHSLAAAHGDAVAAVLLTGMGRDGAEGLLAIHSRGGLTVAQDEKSCVIFGMPRAAIELGAAGHVLALEDMPTEILRLLGERR